MVNGHSNCSCIPILILYWPNMFALYECSDYSYIRRLDPLSSGIETIACQDQSFDLKTSNCNFCQLEMGGCVQQPFHQVSLIATLVLFLQQSLKSPAVSIVVVLLSINNHLILAIVNINKYNLTLKLSPM